MEQDLNLKNIFTAIKNSRDAKKEAEAVAMLEYNSKLQVEQREHEHKNRAFTNRDLMGLIDAKVMSCSKNHHKVDIESDVNSKIDRENRV